MNPTEDNTPEKHLELKAEIDALRKNVDWLSRQLYGRVMPELYTIQPKGNSLEPNVHDPLGNRNDAGPNTLGENPPQYITTQSVTIPPELQPEECILELPRTLRRDMVTIGFETTDAIAFRPHVMLRRWKRSMYVSSDESGCAAASQSPAVFPDPCGSSINFDASFVAFVTAAHIAGEPFSKLAKRLREEDCLTIGEACLAGLFSAASEALAPVYRALTAHSLPDWSNLKVMIEKAHAAGDWFADDFLSAFHALETLESIAVTKANRQGGDPETLYSERRSARRESKRIVAHFFDKCRETLPRLIQDSPLASAVRFALEHESFLSEFLYNPRIELTRANPPTVVADGFTALTLCAMECSEHGLSFRKWVEHTLVKLTEDPTPDPASLFPK